MMQRQKFKTTINAPATTVWDILWGADTYPEWTSVFSEGSRVETNWEKGGKVLFLDGSNNGMVSEIADKVPNQYMSFRHLGNYIDGKEDLHSEEVKKWAGATENYTLTEANGSTELAVDMDMTDEHAAMFTNIMPKALEKVKQLAEQN